MMVLSVLAAAMLLLVTVDAVKELRGVLAEQHLTSDTGWKNFAHYMRDDLDRFIEVSDSAQKLAVPVTQASVKAQEQNIQDIQKALRMSPKTYAYLSKYFDRLDLDRNGFLHEVEFVRAVDQHDVQVAGQDIFLHFAPGAMMDLPQFCRFAMIVISKPSEFHWSEKDLLHLPTHSVGQDQDRLALFKLLMVFDENSDGKVSIVEFENGWMGPLLWKLRNEDVVSSTWMAHDDEFKYANHVFDKRSGEDMQLDLTEWVHLLYEARGNYVQQNSGCISQYGKGIILPTVTTMITSVFA